MYELAIKLLNEISDLGFEAYIVGGFCRDKLLNRKTKDIDICTSATPNDLIDKFNIYKDNSRFGSLTINYEGYLFEVTTFRKDLEYKGRYPKIEYVNSLEEDLKRRDFTINTICIDKDSNIIDLMGAREDLNNKVIKCIGNIEIKLIEDPIRILRAIRFYGEYLFKLDDELKEEIKKYGHLLSNISKTQIEKEVSKMNDLSIKLIKEYELDKYMKEVL